MTFSQLEQHCEHTNVYNVQQKDCNHEYVLRVSDEGREFGEKQLVKQSCQKKGHAKQFYRHCDPIGQS